MKIKKLWETHFFKKRYIMSYKKDIQCFENVAHFSMGDIQDLDFNNLLRKADSRLASYLMIRKNDPAWLFFYYEINNTVLGYSFLHAPLKTEWNDSLPTNNREARVSTDFVYP